MLTETLTTAATLRLISSSALTRSRSEWSIMAISPGLRRLVMFFVLGSTRATATMPGGSAALPRCSSGIFTDGTFIEFHPARAVTRQRPCWPLRRVREVATERHQRSGVMCRKVPPESEILLGGRLASGTLGRDPAFFLDLGNDPPARLRGQARRV